MSAVTLLTLPGRALGLDSVLFGFVLYHLVGLVVNTNGAVTFTDQAVTNFLRQFYRAYKYLSL